VVSAGTVSGLYRTDDGGENWQSVNSDTTIADWYFGRLTADPHDPDTVYIMGRSLRRSTDGGKTLTITKGAPGGDDYHFLWINPERPERMILASDQGTTVTVDGGNSWSGWYNQPTGQFYHVATDNRFPYWVYSGQQDSGTVASASRSDYGQLTFRDWHPVGGDERDYDLPDPQDPHIVYGSGLGGRLSRWDGRTGQVQNVTPWPVSSYAARPTAVKYRYTWLTPLAISTHRPHSLYFASQVLFRSDDGGQTWQTISPDLTGAVARAEGCEESPAIGRARACGYGVIFTIAPSPTVPDQIWVGTDDGLIRLTRDGGRTWHDVTPPGLPEWSKISQIDASPVDPATAYAAVDRHRLDDYGPHAFRTHDYGRTWTEIGHGLPPNAYVNVIRQDLTRHGLLFAGTSRGACVSFDDGDHWQSLQLNLPATGVNDLTIHGDDLIAATQGRALWILDDMSPLRHLANPGFHEAGIDLFPPAVAFRVRGDDNRDTPLPPDVPTAANPPAGAVIDYYLAEPPDGPVMLEIMDSPGELVRRFRSDESETRPRAEQYFADLWLQPLTALPARAGHNRFVWNLRYPRPEAIQYEYSIAAVPSHAPVVPQGPLVPPGVYSVRLTVAGRKYDRPVTVRMDPRVQESAADLAVQLDFEQQAANALARTTSAYRQVTLAAQGIVKLKEKMGNRKDLTGILSDAAHLSGELESFRSGKSENDLSQISDVLASLETDVEGVDRPPTTSQREVLRAYGKRLDTALARWEQLKAGPLSDLDRRAMSAGLGPVLPR
jgi:photosystem II stability/assembly factor-like uncharacterized protein